MSEWTIYGSNGVAKAVVKELELHDEWMAECFLTITVKSAAPIDFEVGDYIDYRGERYTINYDPTVLKKARRGSYGEGFTYDNIKFVAVQDEIVRCDFNDIVLSDNNMHYTMLPTFPFYCETVDDLLDRIQANLEELYPGGWILISPDKDKDRQRGLCVGRQQAFLDAYEEYIGSGTEFEYEKTGVALTADNNTCWDALKWVNERFAMNFIVRGRVVIVGTAGVVTSRKFKYGKGNGLYELERISDSEQKIITRLRGYGAETNLPDRYYAEMNARPFFNVSLIDPDSSTDEVISVLIDNNKFNNVFTHIVDEVYGSMKIATGECEMDGIEFDAAFELVNGGDSEVSGGCTTRMLVGADGSVIIPGYRLPTVPQSVIDALKANMEVGSRIIFNSGVNKKYVDSSHITYSSTGLSDNMAINRLMLPGFPSKSLADWVEDHMDNEKVAAIVAEGFTFSDDVNRPYIDSPNKEIYGIRPSSIYFDGSDENEDIHPSIEGMTWEGRAVDEVVDASTITDNGVLPDDAKDSDKQFTITIPYAGFELPDVIGDDAAIDMKDGMCGARSFKIKRVSENGTNWLCTCERDYDETLKLYFPYSDFQIRERDHFVLTGIELPNSYIEAASEKLFFACVDALRANHAPRYTFQPRIDELWMQRQHDTAVASHGVIESLHDTLKAGDIFAFMDEDLGIDAKIIIDILTIKENGNNSLATYEVTLRDEKVVSAIDKRLDKIQSIASSGFGVSARQTSSLVSEEGSELFLSRLYDDVAQGVIGFLRGAWFGTKQWMIDALGDANLHDVTVNGLLKAYNAIINNVRSTNYTGDGIMDSGWRITNEYEGNNSKATFDFLYIRKKAIFEELEIRKLSHIGGNFCLSGASGRVWRVEYFDANGEPLGYDTYTVPWTLGGRLLLLFNKSAFNRFFGRKKTLQRKLTDAERQRVATIRCYMFTDDGSTETMGNWTVGAQARCQQFNVVKQMEFDGSSWKGTKVGNTYWYRLVSAVGDKKMDDGLKHEYVEFRVDQTKEGTAYEWADALSDFPSVGDVFVQMGHRTRQDQSNVIMLETANDDSPSIKMYAGVNWWTIDENNLVAKMSPDGWKVAAESFEWITRYGERFKQTVNRGVWVQIPLEDGVRKCYYNDMVSHNGSYWRCIVAQGSYTTDEPSESSSAWSKEVYAGIAPYVLFSEQMVAIPCEKDSKASSAKSLTITVKLMVTNLEATISSVTLTGGDSHVSKSGNNIVVSFVAGATVTNKDYTVTVEGDLNGNHYIATDKISVYAVVRGNDAYEVTAEPTVFIWSQQEVSPYSINIDKSENGNSSLGISVTNGGVSQPFQITNVVATGRNSSGQATTVVATYSNISGRVWVTSIANDTVSGQLAVYVRYGDNATQTLIVPFYCNLIGTWQEQVVGDTKTEVAERMQFDICDETGAVVTTSTLANFVKSSSRQEATLTKTTETQGQQITATNSRVDTAESSIQTLDNGLGALTTRVTTAEGNITTVSNNLSNNYSTTSQTSSMISSAVSGLASESYVRQTATSISSGVQTTIEGKLHDTGIEIQGSNRSIVLKADKVTFSNSDGSVTNKISIDPTTGTLIAYDGVFSGQVSAGTTNKITLGPDLAGTGAFVRGTRNDDELLFFGYSSNRGKVKAAYNTYQYVEMINDASFSGVRMVKENTSVTPSEIMELKVGVDANGKVVIRVPSTEVGTTSDMWKKESEALKGEVYVDNTGYLKLKRT